MSVPPPIIPKTKHLQVCMYVLIVLAIWPLDFIGYPRLGKFYKHFGILLYAESILFVVMQVIEMLRLILYSDNVGRLMQNIGMTMLLFISVFRTKVVRSNLSKKIVKFILEKENYILGSDDEEVKEIYNFYANLSRIANVFFLFVGYLTAVFFIMCPKLEEYFNPELYTPDPVTGKYNVTRLIPLSAYFPFDTNEYYDQVFNFEIFQTFLSEGFVVYTDSYMFSLMIFAVGQMKIIQHLFKNYHKYAVRVAKNMNLPYETASKTTLRSIILYHKEIIAFVGEVDEALRATMLLDFMSCSLQMSVVLFQIIMFPFGTEMILAVEFLISMVIQMFLFYWNANEIIIESRNIATSITDSEWYNECEEIKQNMKFIIMRAQKSLYLYIGPFYPMSTEAALSILKATYSYGMLLRQSYNRNRALDTI